MDQVGFLNLEYFFYAVYRLVSDAEVPELAARFGSFVDRLELIGLIASFFLLIALIYTKMRESQALHGIHEAREEAVKRVAGEEKVKNERWKHVMALVNSSNPNDWRQAVMESDIILGLLLDELQVPGDTIGEKLKAVDRTRFTTLDFAWDAHRVRNEVAHTGSTYDLTQREARRVIDLFRRVFEEFDFI